MNPIKLVVISSGRLTRDMLRRSLPAHDPRFTCMEDLPCDEEVVRHCRALAPDLVVFEMSGRTASEMVALAELASVPAWALLVISGGAPDHVLAALVERERCGIFCRNSSLDALASAAHLVALGGSYFDRPMLELLRRRGQPAEPALSQRERHVLQLVAEGYSTKEVADILQLSIKTVDNYRTSLMQKLDVHDVVRLTHHAIRIGLVRV